MTEPNWHFISNVRLAPDFVCQNCDWPVYVFRGHATATPHVTCPCGEVDLGEGVLEDLRLALSEDRVTLEEVF